MKNKYILFLLPLLFPIVAAAQATDEVKSKINSIKKSSQYLWADVTAANEQDAKDLAEDELYQNINEWVATKEKLRGSSSLVVNNKRELWAELKMPRGNMFRSFLYVKKKDIQGVENATVIENVNKTAADGAGVSAVEEVFDYQPTPTVKALMDCKKYAEFTALIKTKKAEGKVTFYGRYASLEKPEIYFLAVYNRAGEMVAMLTPGPNRINVQTKKADDVANYSGCGAIGFTINEK